MNIDFTKDIIQMKERNVLHKPFPTPEGYALFEKTKEGKIVRMTFSSEEGIKAYLNSLGYDWGNEKKDEFRNFDCLNRILTVYPELENAEIVAADPQWDPDAKPETLHEKHDLHRSSRTMEDLPDLAVELREVDHPLHWDESNYDNKAHSDSKCNNPDCKCETCSCDPCECEENLAKKPDFLKKKGDKKDDKKNGKKGDKKNGKKGDEEEKDKNGKKLPPWLNKKKSKSNYDELWEKVSGKYGGNLKVGDNVKNTNPKCTHFKSEGVVKKFNKIPGDKGMTVAYQCTNAGKTWDEGDTLEKTPDQLTKGDCSSGKCIY